MGDSENVDAKLEKKEPPPEEPKTNGANANDVKADTKAEAKPDANEPKAEAKAEKSADKSGENPFAQVKLSEHEPKKKKGKKQVEYAVRLTRVTKRFGVKTAVDGVTLKIKQGSVYGLIGPNGAGKTTTFSMMAGYLRPTEGEIEMLGFAPSQVNELRARLGVLPQDALLPSADYVGEFLVHMARLQNIPADHAEEAARAVLTEVDGRDWWKTRCGALSHGMAKRVQFAQAILGEPEIVLLDEPTAGLDPRVAYEIRQLVKARSGRCTMIVSSHNLQELEEICDGAAILDRGRVVASGSISELTASTEEVHIKLSPGRDGAGAYRAPVPPIAEIRELQMVTRVEWDEEKSEIVVYFDRKSADAEQVIGATLWILLNKQARIAGVSKGRGLEQRVMELT